LAAPVVIIVITIVVVVPVTHPLVVVVLTVSHVLPLLPALELFAVVIVFRCGTRDAHRIAVQFKSASNFAVYRVQQDAFPNRSHSASRTKSFSLPKQAQVLLRKFQAQYQAFVRFAVTSSAALSAIALKWTWLLEPFTRGGLSL